MWIDPLLNLVFPPVCEVCRNRSQETLCRGCFEQVKFMKPQLGIYSTTVYEGVIKTALHRLKFQKRRKLAAPLGVLAVRYLCNLPSFKMSQFDCIVPVPLHQKRLRDRGFNQSALLAETIGKYFEVPVAQALKKVKDTHPQFDLPREKRLLNVKGAFRVADPGAIAGRQVLLFDDIYTTGATAAECAAVMLNSGARKVEILTLARALEM